MTTGTRSQAAAAGVEPTPASPRYAARCGAKRKQGDHSPCTQRRGFRTDHPGSGRCWLHGGRSPTGRAAAAKEQVDNELRRLAIPLTVDPISSLFESVRIASWRELGIRTVLQRRQHLASADHLGDGREDIVSAMHARAVKQKAEIASMAINAGLDQRLVEIAERQADVVVLAVQAALDSVGADGEARAKAEAAAADVMDPTPPVGVALN